MKSKFKENQWVILIGGQQKMRVVENLTHKNYGGDAFGFNKWEIDTGVPTGQVRCVWIDANTNTERYGEYDERNLEACD